jgi:hypothetical protein
MAGSKKSSHIDNCPPMAPRFKQPEAPFAATAYPIFDQCATSSKPFPKDVGCVYEGDDSAMCFDSHTNGKKGK